MADLTKTVEIIFGGKNELTGVMGNLEKDFTTMNTSIKDTTQPLANLADNIFKVDAALAALVVGGMALAVKESSEFNKQFALISTSIDATGGDLEKYRNDVLNYSTTSVKSMSDINSALYTAAQAGVKWSESLEFMRKSEELAVANNANLNTTVDLLTGTMNAYGYKLADVGHLNDVFFTSTLIGKQTIDELGVSMGQVVGIAANAGVSFEQLSAAIATLTAKGMTTENAITAVKGVITSIISPSKEAADAARALGLNFSLTEMTSKGFAGMLNEIMLKTGGSKEKMVELFAEVRAMNGVLSLTGDGMAFFKDALDKVNNSAGSATAAYEKMVNTFSNQSQMALNAVHAVMVSIGTELEPVAGKFASSVAGIFSGIKTAVDNGEFKPLFDFITQMGTELAEQLAVIAKNLPAAMKGLDFSTLINSLKGLGGSLGAAFESLFGEIDLSTVEGLHAFVQRVIDAFAKLIDVTKGVIDGMKPLFEAIGTVIQGFESADGKTAEFVGTLIGAGKAINVIADYAGILTGALGVLAGKALVDAVAGIAKLGSSAIGAIPGITTLMANLGTLGSVGAVGAAGGIGYFVGSLLNQIPAVQDAAQGLIGLLDVNDNYFGAIQGTKAEQDALNKKFEESRVAANKVKDSTEGLTQAQIDSKNNAMTYEQALAMVWESMAKGGVAIASLGQEFKKLPDKKTITVGVQADGSSIEKAYGMIIQTFPDGSIRIVQAHTNTNAANLADTKKKIDDTVPAAKVMEVQASIDIAKIKESSEIVQKSIEWKAKLDIAEIEANAKIIEAAFKSIDNTITSTGTTLSNIVSSYGTLMAAGGSGGNAIYDEMRAESQRRDAALVLQKDLTEAEIANLNARTESMKKGEAIIKIDGTGLQPHLEAFMYEILAAIQVKATSEGMKLLV